MNRTRFSQSELIDRYRACERKLGKAPGTKLFCKTAGVPLADVLHHWPRFADFVREAGSTPSQWRTAYPDAEVFADYARVCLRVNKLPARGELRIATRDLGTKTHRVYERFGSIAEFDRRFRDWLATGPEEFKVILSYPGWERVTGTKAGRTHVQLVAVRPFLPAGLQYLDTLARGELPIGESSEFSINIQFERKCGEAFQALGFEVSQLGQGKGRAPDVLAIARRVGYGVIIDAKVRREGYKLGTEDRTFHEYVVRYTLQLKNEGIDKAYLVVIASKFRESDHPKLANYLAGSDVRGIAFLSAASVMRIVEESIRDRAAFTLAEFEKVLFGSRILLA
jgi:hypothetical protein